MTPLPARVPLWYISLRGRSTAATYASRGEDLTFYPRTLLGEPFGSIIHQPKVVLEQSKLRFPSQTIHPVRLDLMGARDTCSCVNTSIPPPWADGALKGTDARQTAHASRGIERLEAFGLGSPETLSAETPDATHTYPILPLNL